MRTCRTLPALNPKPVLLVLSVIAKLFGLDLYLAERGGSLSGLLWLSALFGFGGAFISLALSKPMALMALQRSHGQPLPGQFQAFGIHAATCAGSS